MNLKKTLLATVIAFSIGGCSDSDDNSDNDSQPQKATNLTQSWQSVDNGLDTPESVIHDSVSRVIYASNINSSVSGASWADNGGYISRLDENGSILEQQWASGLKAPKGMAVNNYKLYVADLNTISVIDTTTGNIQNTYTAPSGADHLNDIVYDQSNDVVYVTDSSDKVIYKMDSNGTFSVFYAAESNSAYQNGLYLDGTELIMTGSNGSIKSINIEDENLSTIAEGIAGNIDGIWKYNSTGFIVSVWEGTVFYVGNDGVVGQLISTDPSRTADISYSSSLNLLLVPDFNDKVIAYSVN